MWRVTIRVAFALLTPFRTLSTMTWLERANPPSDLVCACSKETAEGPSPKRRQILVYHSDHLSFMLTARRVLGSHIWRRGVGSFWHGLCGLISDEEKNTYLPHWI